MNSLYTKISDVLEMLLADTEHLVEPAPSNTYPLFLLLTVRPNLVGFAALDGQVEKNFTRAFGNFRDSYSTHSAQWADFDLSLVLCSKETLGEDDEFLNAIEIDPYFCRKFVIDLTHDLEPELGRLPFIPLRPEKIVGLTRPVSAQTFLKEHGVASDLARYIAIPHARGIERIADESIRGHFGEPRWREAEVKEIPLPHKEVSTRVRLKEIKISNFRAYRSHTFDLDADLVVLYGANGLGKTSLFDAIDFACTGSVGRFDHRFGRNVDRLTRVLKHLDSSEDESFVAIKALKDEKFVTLERYLRDRTTSYIDGDANDRKRTLMSLVGLSEEPPDLRIDNLVRLFRASHVFGQEYQFLTSGFQESSRLPQDTVSRMLALQDYVEGINKSKRVSRETNRRIGKLESEIGLLEESLKTKEKEVGALKRSAEVVQSPAALSKLGMDIGERIRLSTDISVEIPREINKDVLRDWRSILGTKIESFARKSDLFRNLEEEVPVFMDHQEKLEQRSSELAEKNGFLSQLEKYSVDAKERLRKISASLEKVSNEEKDHSLKMQNQEWSLEGKVEYERLRKLCSKEDKNVKASQVQLLELLPEIEELRSGCKVIEDRIGQITSEIKSLKDVAAKAIDLEKSVDDWRKSVNRHSKLKTTLQKAEQQISSLKTELGIERDNLQDSHISSDKLKRDLEKEQKSHTDLQNLLDDIEGLISGNVCPVCGTSHESREELVEKLRVQRGTRPKQVQDIMEAFQKAQHRTDGLEERVSALELKTKQSQKEVAEIRKEMSDLREKIKTYEEIADSLEIPITLDKLADIIDSKRKHLIEQIKTKNQELLEQTSTLKKQQQKLSSSRTQQRSLTKDLNSAESKRRQLHSMIDNIRTDASDRGVTLDVDREEIQNNINKTKTIVAQLRRKVEGQQSDHRNILTELSKTAAEMKVLKEKAKQLEEEITVSKKHTEKVKNLAKQLELKLKLDMSRDEIRSLRKEVEKEEDRLGSLVDEIANLEIALDSLQISASLLKAQEEIKRTKRRLQDLGNERERLRNWFSYFKTMSSELGLLQNRTLREYTEKYGPLTSTIQKRLRSIYGFGNILLEPRRGGIEARVERMAGKNVLPSDYFSGSQIQVVMLSLFLTAALTQTWSSFAPILIDDPVQHFDDLNTYSFLDLVRGLVVGPDRECQFIISTCEDRLFRLMRQKFGKMEQKVNFYVFDSIGENGPKIRKL